MPPLPYTTCTTPYIYNIYTTQTTSTYITYIPPIQLTYIIYTTHTNQCNIYTTYYPLCLPTPGPARPHERGLHPLSQRAAVLLGREADETQVHEHITYYIRIPHIHIYTSYYIYYTYIYTTQNTICTYLLITSITDKPIQLLT
jgi:hypothetical protein